MIQPSCENTSQLDHHIQILSQASTNPEDRFLGMHVGVLEHNRISLQLNMFHCRRLTDPIDEENGGPAYVSIASLCCGCSGPRNRCCLG